MNYLLSIIIPTYNCADFICETMDTIIGFLPDNCEMVLVDDGSTDNTPELLRPYADAHKNVNVYCNEHKGVSGARNAGIEHASGRYITFMDCDDCITPDFLEKSLPLTESNADLYIFGIKRIPLKGNPEFWTVKDKVYSSASDFADEYIRTRRLLVYSNCNKFYKKQLIDKMQLHFEERISFGEDRLFNYSFITFCESIVTSSLTMLHYLQRSEDSGSSKHIPDFFRRILALHEAKMKCFLRLSEGTTDLEKASFKAYDLTREIENTLQRFREHPEEKEENLPVINHMIFGDPCDSTSPVDIIIVFGSKNCSYKAEAAFKLLNNNPKMRFLLSGGNLYSDDIRTEAEFMRDYLLEHGVTSDKIFMENRAICTNDNINLSDELLCMLRETGEFSCKRVGILTSGFHLPRTRYMIESKDAFKDYSITYFNCFGASTGPDNWYETDRGRLIILTELSKLIKLYYT